MQDENREEALVKLGEALQAAIDCGITKKSDMTSEEVKQMLADDDQ